MAGTDSANIEIQGTVGTYYGGSDYRCGALITMRPSTHIHFTSPDHTITVGDQWNSATYVIMPAALWTDQSTMLASAVYLAMSTPSPSLGIWEIGDSDSDDLIVEATAG